MPSMHERDDDRVRCGNRFRNRTERPVGLRGIPEPTFVVRLDEVKIVLGRCDMRLLTETKRLVICTGTATRHEHDHCDQADAAQPLGLPKRLMQRYISPRLSRLGWCCHFRASGVVDDS